MTLAISLTPQARDDLVDIWEYSYRQWDADQADSYLNQLKNGLETLARSPEIGVDYGHIRRGYRKFRIVKHNLFYTASATELLIVRVLHIAMDAENRLS